MSDERIAAIRAECDRLDALEDEYRTLSAQYPHEDSAIYRREEAIEDELRHMGNLTWGDVRYLLDHIAALEARNRELEFKWESKEPGTQGAILDAFYALVETLPEYNPVMSEGHLNVLRKHLDALERGLQFAILHIEGGRDLLFSTREKTPALHILRRTLAGEDLIKPHMLERWERP